MRIDAFVFFVFQTKFFLVSPDSSLREKTQRDVDRLPTIHPQNCKGDCRSSERCCLDERGDATCCPKFLNKGDEDYRTIRQDDRQRRMFNSSYRYPSFWNMWYFWFVIIMVLAICFTGCNYWRRMRELQLRHVLGGGHYPMSLRGRAQPQIIIPVTMYEIPPSVMRIMAQHTSEGDHHQAHSSLPPSYSEVTNKPDDFPPACSGDEDGSAFDGSTEAEPPAYDIAVARSHQAQLSHALTRT